MNPPAGDDADSGYAGSEPLDRALTDRFAFVVGITDWPRAAADGVASLGNSLEQLGRPHAQRSGKPNDIEQRDIPLTTFDSANVVSMEASRFGEILLRKATRRSELANMAA